MSDVNTQITLATPEPTPKRKAGRPKGSRSYRSLMAREYVESLGPGADPLLFLLRVVKNKRVDLQTRIDAAGRVLPFIFPKLSIHHVEAKTDKKITVEAGIVLQRAMADPETAAVLERLSLMQSEATRDSSYNRRSPHVIDVPTLPSPESSE